MQPTLAGQLDALDGWRRGLDRRLAGLARLLAEHALLGDEARIAIDTQRRRLAGDRLTVAFVAEFSRGKSELINAIFFAATGRRLLPAQPGRTTMCPVEIGWDAALPPQLALLPLASRLDPRPLEEWRREPGAWTCIALDPADAARSAGTLLELTRTRALPLEEARALGLLRGESPHDVPPPFADGLVEVPAWRHARLNYPHPLLERGLSVLDTPGLNAIGAEPELTLSLLPAAHAVVFLLAADSGVTRSDLAIWRDHLGGMAGGSRGGSGGSSGGAAAASLRFVVLNKIDALADPLSDAATIAAQIGAQREAAARLLGVPLAHVLPLSGRQALAARIGHDDAALAASGVPALEAALSDELLASRRRILGDAVSEVAGAVTGAALLQLADQRRQVAEQLAELRVLQGRSGGRCERLLQRVAIEASEFERCSARIGALRVAHAKLVQDMVAPLSDDALRRELSRFVDEVRATFLNFGARNAFVALCVRLRGAIEQAGELASEGAQMLQASQQQLNAEFGFALTPGDVPNFSAQKRDLQAIESNYGQYLGLSHMLKLADGSAVERLRRMLASRLGLSFEQARNDAKVWSRQALAQIAQQLRERRGGFDKRREALERVQAAGGQLELRVEELGAQERGLRALRDDLQGRCAALRQAAAGELGDNDTLLRDDAEPAPPAAAAGGARVDIVA